MELKLAFLFNYLVGMGSSTETETLASGTELPSQSLYTIHERNPTMMHSTLLVNRPFTPQLSMLSFLRTGT